jgi:hypothetical protein
MPNLLGQLASAEQQAVGDDKRRIAILTAEAYQVTGSVLLKLDDVSLAMLAADRSMAAAVRSEDPIAVAASARVLTHALISSGHPRRAARLARAMAEGLDREAARPTAESLAVYGALLLRGAIAAAQCEDRAATRQLLDEASTAASRIGRDGNLRWTAFGPSNVLLHRLSVCVALGDAGQAIDFARRVQLESVRVAERRASYFIDVGRAFAQWGKHDKAYQALRKAEETSPQEVRVRRSVHRLVTDLTRAAPNRLQPRFREMAERIGAAL